MKGKFYPLSFFIAAIFLSFASFSQNFQPATWRFSKEKIAGDEYLLHFDVTLDQGWNIYSQYIGGDENSIRPVPTSFHFEKNKKIELIGKTEEAGEHVKEGKDALFDDLFVKKFSGSVRFTQKVKVSKGAKELKGYLEFMTCDDEKCLPPSQIPFSFVFDDSQGSLISFNEEGVWASLLFSIIPQTSAQTLFDQNTSSGFIEPVKWSFKKELVQGDEYRLIFEASIDSGWYLYSQHIGGNEDDIRPVPTSFTFDKNAKVEFIGKVEETGEHVIEKEDPLFDSIYVKKFSGKGVFTQLVKISRSDVIIKGSLEFMTCNEEMCLPPQTVEFAFSDEDGGEIAGEEDAPNRSLLGIFIGGFLGGLLALLTPCVFPMIPMTVSFFTKTSKTRRKGIINAFGYGFSIIIIYVSLGILITLLFGSDALNAMASDIYFNIAFFIIFIVFAISFFGFFDITLPSSFVNKVDRMSDKGGWIGIFFMAFTLSLVSFSCTGPIIGSLLVEAAVRGSTVGPMVGMMGFSLALALPFGLFAAFPGWMNSLPKSGGWLNAVKVQLGFLELALALKFISTVDLAYHWNFIKREIFIGIWILVLLGMLVYTLGLIRFPHDGAVKKFSRIRLAFALPILAVIFLLIPGLQGAPLKALSGFLPPGYYSIYSNNSCPLDLDCFHDLHEGIAYAKKHNKPIMIDFTGYSCANCRWMEDYVWANPDVLKYIKEEYVLISLYVDDKSKLPAAEQKMSKCTNKKLKTLGNKWHDYQQCRFKQAAQPYYVLMTPDEKELNTPRGMTRDKDEYIKFLQEGLDNFKSGNVVSSLE
ncbi:MAG TPA: cytochrome c biogenesis protein CcdA [Chitinophagales bacterium]|nr:cytochrome c biogenesis protein CcdA [Chitinophagales bacterium]